MNDDRPKTRTNIRDKKETTVKPVIVILMLDEITSPVPRFYDYIIIISLLWFSRALL